MRKVRVIIAWVVIVAALVLVFGHEGQWVRDRLGWIAKAQVVPAVLAGTVVALVCVAVLTLVFGRLYCSVLCPTGIMQDGVSWLGGRKGKVVFRYTKPKTWLRVAVLVVFMCAVIFGFSALVSLLDPWAIFSRTVGAGFGGNIVVVCVAVVTLAVIFFLAWRGGRTWCNTICPVGTILGYVGCKPLLAPRFDVDKCTKCGLCEKNCKSSCVDAKAQTIDRTRCVACYDCVDACKFGAMKVSTPAAGCGCGCGTSDKHAAEQGAATAARITGYAEPPAAGGGGVRQSSAKPEKGGGDLSAKGGQRRNFLTVAGLLAVSGVRAQQLRVDGGLADIEAKKRPVRRVPVTPPGSKGARNMAKHCSACQLCVTACPNNVLVPSTKLSTMMQPEMTFEKGFCRPECVQCSELCPAGAIRKITTADKTAISVGKANWIEANCVVGRDNLPCTACERHCPTKAITLVPLNAEEAAKEAAPPPRRGSKPTVLKRPVIDNTKCIGCGACEHHCPARPFAAIYVEGNVEHHEL